MRKNWDVPENFPNSAVIKAYRAAKVDESRDKFTYGRPDLQLLRQFCLDKFGWPQDKADELLVPVLKVGMCFHLCACITSLSTLPAHTLSISLPSGYACHCLNTICHVPDAVSNALGSLQASIPLRSQ